MVADNEEVRLFDRSELASDLPTHTISAGAAVRLQAFGSHVLASAPGDVRLLDFSDPTAPTETALGEGIFAAAGAGDVVFAVTRDSLLVLGWDGTEIGRVQVEALDIDENLGFTPLVGADGATVVVSPSFGVSFNEEPALLLVFDVSDPTAPVLTDRYEHESTYIEQLAVRGDTLWIRSRGALLGGPLSEVPNLAAWEPRPGFERVGAFGPYADGWWVAPFGEGSEPSLSVAEWTPDGPGATIVELPYLEGGPIADVAYDGTHLAAARGSWGHSVHGVACD